MLYPSILFSQNIMRDFEKWGQRPVHVLSRSCLDAQSVSTFKSYLPKKTFLFLGNGNHERDIFSLYQETSFNLRDALNNQTIKCLRARFSQHFSQLIHGNIRESIHPHLQQDNVLGHQQEREVIKSMEDRLLTVFSNGISPLVPKSIRDEAIGDFLELHETMQDHQVQVSRRVSITIARLISLLPAGIILSISSLLQSRRRFSWLNFYGRGSGSHFLVFFIITCLSLMGSR